MCIYTDQLLGEYNGCMCETKISTSNMTVEYVGERAQHQKIINKVPWGCQKKTCHDPTFVNKAFTAVFWVFSRTHNQLGYQHDLYQ